MPRPGPSGVVTVSWGMWRDQTSFPGHRASDEVSSPTCNVLEVHEESHGGAASVSGRPPLRCAAVRCDGCVCLQEAQSCHWITRMRDAYFIIVFRVMLGCGLWTRSWNVGRVESTPPFVRTQSAICGWLGVAPVPSFCRLAVAFLPRAPRAAGKAIYE